jgi:hypothetical protein
MVIRTPVTQNILRFDRTASALLPRRVLHRYSWNGSKMIQWAWRKDAN